jgi:hypothetical protein
MRILMALAICACGLFALEAALAADDVSPRDKTAVAKKKQRTAGRHLSQRERVECQRARMEDPAGEFARFPCWAREAFARGRRLHD